MGPNSDEFEDLSDTVKDIIEEFPQENAVCCRSGVVNKNIANVGRYLSTCSL